LTAWVVWYQKDNPPVRINNAYIEAYPPQGDAANYPVGTECTRQYPGSKWWNLGSTYYSEAHDLSYRAVMAWEGCAYRPHTANTSNVWFLDGHVQTLGKAGMQELIIAPGDSDPGINWNDDGFQNSWPFYQ